MRRVYLIFLSLMVMLGACQSLKNPDDLEGGNANLHTRTPENSVEQLVFTKKPPLDSNFILRMNEEENEVYLSGNVAVKLMTIKDNRCPTGTECVRAGEVFVVLQVDFVGEDPFEETLTLGGDSETQPRYTVFYGNTFLTLQSVTPVPNADGSVKPDDQTVTLSVTSHALE